MSQEPDADDKELLESICRGLRKSVAFWSPESKVEREIYAVRTLLQHLGIEHDPNEIRPEPAEPPDINFRDARFEIKEMLDEGRRRHDEYRKKLERALRATSAREVMEQYTPTDLTFDEINGRLVEILHDTSKHYAATVINQLDLLVYANLLHRVVALDSRVPNSSSFAGYGWRSVSAVRGSMACVFFARADAPDFLRSRVGKPLARPSVE